MPRYMGHKPSWRQQSNGPKSSPASGGGIIIETQREPSGAYSARSVYKPPSEGPRSVPAISNPVSSSYGGWASQGFKNAETLAKYRKWGVSGLQIAQWAYNHRDEISQWSKKDLDDFLRTGNLPAPFDFLNPQPGPLWPGDGAAVRPGEPWAKANDAPVSGQDYYSFTSGSDTILVPSPNGFAGGTVTVSSGLYNPLHNDGWHFLGWNTQTRPVGGAYPHPQWTQEAAPPTRNLRFYNRDQTLGSDLDWVVIGVDYATNRPAWPYVDGIFVEPGKGVDVASALANIRNNPRPFTVNKVVVSSVPHKAVPYTPWRLQPFADRVRQAMGVQVRFTIDDGLGDKWGTGAVAGTQVSAGGAGGNKPVTGVGPSYPHPPPRGEKQKKAKMGLKLFKLTQKVFHEVTEYSDLLDALWDAIPKQYRNKKHMTLAEKSWDVFKNFDHVDIGDAVVNILWNEIEDRIIGRGFGAVDKAARKLGQPQYKVLNSANDFGGVDEMGELYGDFSKQYVKPNKDALKKYLTDNFGI